MKKLYFIIYFLAVGILTNAQEIINPAIFPIELRYFNAVKEITGTTVLRWLAPCQTNEAKFEIQHSADAHNFTTIHTLVADQQRCFQPFDFTDVRLLSGKNYYRIRLTTPANVSINSYIIPVVAKGAGFELNSLWPSVVSGTTVLNFSSGKNDQLRFFITDMNGRILQTFTQQTNTGNNQLPLNFNTFNAGHYLIKAVNASNEKRIIRFQKL